MNRASGVKKWISRTGLLVVGVLALGTDARAQIRPPLLFHGVLSGDGQGLAYFGALEGLGPAGGTHHGEQGSHRPGQIRLFRGLTSARDWWDWRQQVLDGHLEQARHQITISLVDQTGVEAFRWTVDRAWPVDIKDSLLADGSVEEELVLACEGVTLVNPPSASQ
jgi:phage tail-like protein